MRRFVVAEQRERTLAAIAGGLMTIQEPEAIIGDEIGDIARSLDHGMVTRLEHDGVVVVPLSREYPPEVETGGVVGWSVAEMPLAEHAGAIPGAVLGLVDAGGARALRSGGFAQTTPVERAMRDDTVFDLASLTKVLFTTPRVLTLAEAGALERGRASVSALRDAPDEGRARESEVVGDAEISAGGRIIQLDASAWQHVIELQSRLAQYLEQIGQPQSPRS